MSERDPWADMDRRNGVYERFRARARRCALARECCRQKTDAQRSKRPASCDEAVHFFQTWGSSTVRPRPRHSTKAPERAADAMSEYETRPHVSGLKRKALVSVEYVPKKEDMAEGPFVCRLGATGGLPPPGTEFRAWRKNLPYRGHMMLLRGRTDGVDYIGANHAPLGHYPAGDACKYLLGKLVPVNQKGKGGGGGGGDDDAVEYELKLMPVGGSRVVDLECRCHALDYNEPEWDGAEDLNDYQVRAAHNARLLKAFASAKQQRKVAKIMAERRVDGNTIAAPDAMEATLKRATEGEMDASQLSKLAGERRNIPEHNPSATNAIDAYPFNQFLGVRAAGEADQVEGDGQGREEARRDEGAEGRRRRRRLRPRARPEARRALGRRDRSRGERPAEDAPRRSPRWISSSSFSTPRTTSRRSASGARTSTERRRRRRVHRKQDPVVDHAGARGPRDPARVRRRVHGGAALRRRGQRRRREGPRRTQAVLAPEGDEGPRLSPRHPHGAQVCNYDVDLDALGARMKMGVKAPRPCAESSGAR